LYEKSRGSGSEKLRPHDGHARRVEYTLMRPIEHVHDALAEVERALQRRAQLALVARRDGDRADRQLDRVLLEAVEPRPAIGRQLAHRRRAAA
jgi:hypothetical protein